MAQIRAIDLLRDGIVGNFGNVGMTVTAFDGSVNASIINCFINIIIPPPAVFIDAADKAVFVAHQAVFFIGCFGLGTAQQKNAYPRREQQGD